MRRLSATPHLDAWRAAFLAATAARGSKTALARHMAAITGQSVHLWKGSIAKLARPGSMINAEYLLAITAWLDASSSSSIQNPKSKIQNPLPLPTDATGHPGKNRCLVIPN